MHLLSLSFVNACGCQPAAFVGSVLAGMHYAAPLPAVSPVTSQPVIGVALPELAGLSRPERLFCLLDHLLAALPDALVFDRLVLVSGGDAKEDEELRQRLTARTTGCFPWLGEVDIHCRDVPLLDTDQEVVLILALDSLVDARSLAQLASMPLQQRRGPPAAMPGEGAAALLCSPHFPPVLDGTVDLQAGQGTLAAQLAQAKITGEDLVVLAGPDSSRWHRQWYADSHEFYRRADRPAVVEMTRITGYLGHTTLAMAWSLAAAALQQPGQGRRRSVVVDHLPGRAPRVYTLVKNRLQ